jgi:hypothetical protein
MMSVSQIAERYCISESLVYSWIGSGLPHYRFGKKGRRGKIMVDEDELKGFIEGMKVEGRPSPASGRAGR